MRKNPRTLVDLPTYSGHKRFENPNEIENFKPEFLFKQMIAKQNPGDDSLIIDQLFKDSSYIDDLKNKPELDKRAPRLNLSAKKSSEIPEFNEV